MLPVNNTEIEKEMLPHPFFYFWATTGTVCTSCQAYLSRNSVVVTPEFREPPRRPTSADFGIPARFRFPVAHSKRQQPKRIRIWVGRFGRLQGIEP